MDSLAALAWPTLFHRRRSSCGTLFILSIQLYLINDAFQTYGPIIRISPDMVLVNDPEAVSSIFAKTNFDTAPKAIRALRVGGHDWTVTYPCVSLSIQLLCFPNLTHLSSVLNFPSESDMARPRRRPVMLATTTKNLKYWRSLFETYSDEMISAIGASGRTKSVDIVRQLRITTLNNSQVIMGGTGVKLDPTTFPDVVGEYNFLVVWRLALPEWMFKWLRWGPSSKARFRIRSSRLLYEVRIWRKLDFCNAA